MITILERRSIIVICSEAGKLIGVATVLSSLYLPETERCLQSQRSQEYDCSAPVPFPLARGLTRDVNKEEKYMTQRDSMFNTQLPRPWGESI